MKRVRVIITEINITKLGQVHHFQIKLPKNTTCICGIETDVRIDSIDFKSLIKNGVVAELVTKPFESTLEVHPFLNWGKLKNPTLGRLKLQSLERSHIFYSDWVKCIWLNGGIDDMSNGLFPVNPYSLNKPTKPRKVDLPVSTTLINGLFIDSIGLYYKKHLTYSVKIFVWIETTEEANGVVYDFQNFT